MRYQDSLHDLREAAGQKAAVLLEEVQANAIIVPASTSRLFLSLDLIENFSLALLIAFLILCGLQCLELLLLILFTHEAHASKLRPNVINLHPRELMLFTYLSDLLGLEHPAALILIAVILLLALLGVVGARSTLFIHVLLILECHLVLVHYLVF